MQLAMFPDLERAQMLTLNIEKCCMNINGIGGDKLACQKFVLQKLKLSVENLSRNLDTPSHSVVPASYHRKDSEIG